jgi:undecaprenyl-diphosphatase
MLKRILLSDAQLSQRLRIAEQPGPLRQWAAFLAHSGDSWFWLLGLAVLWLAGSPAWKTRAIVFIVSILVTAVLVLAVKFTVRRSRPPGEWGAIYRQTDPHSFPSGHAARAILLAVLAVLSGPAWFALLLVIWAPLVSLARIAMGVHYVSDVLAGMLFGALSALLIWQVLIGFGLQLPL